MTFQFQGNNYANEHEMQGQFHHQLFSCRSDFEETGRVSLNPTTLLVLACESYIETTFYCLTTVYYYDKIASEGKGSKPSSDREKYIAESEFALLGILSKQCLIIYFYLDSSEQHRWKQK